MNKYELMVIGIPAASEEENEKFVEALDKEIAQNKGTIEKKEVIGRKELAYKIKGNAQGYRVLYVFDMDSKNVKAFEKRVKMMQNVIRYLLLKLDLKKQEVTNG